MKTLYFSFIGGCKGYQVETVESNAVGQLLHEVNMCNGSISIYNYQANTVLVVCENELNGEWDESLYICKRNSFDCLPAVPVSSIGEAVYNALH